MSCVYKLTFPNGAVYVGKTAREPKERWMNGWGYKDMPLVFNCIIQYGWDNVDKKIIADGLTGDEAKAKEAEMIKYYSRKALAHNELHSEDSSTEGSGTEAAAQDDDVCTLILNDYGVDPEYTMSLQKGFITPDSLKSEKKIKGASGNVVNGHHVGPVKQHIVPLVEKPVEMRTCPIKVYNMDGEMLAIYPSIKIASEETGVTQGDIVSCCKGKRGNDGRARYQSKGMVFRYAPYANTK